MTSLEQRKTYLLVLAQALAQSNQIIFIALSGLVGLKLAPDPGLATLPVALVVICNAAFMFPASNLMKRIGQRPAFLVGTGFGMASGLLSAVGIWQESFLIFVLGNGLLGFSGAFAQFYRFAAADAVRPEFKSRALSLVLVAGVGAAFLGPALVRQTQNLGSIQFLVPFLAITGLSLLAFLFVLLNPLDSKRQEEVQVPGRPLKFFLSHPPFLLAVLASASSFLVMALVMTATPLAMKGCGHSPGASTTVIQWHVLGMYVPSFFSGALLARFGLQKMMVWGLAILAFSALSSFLGIEMPHFLVSLTLLGIGWNFLFVSGSSLLTQVYQPSEKTMVQACHDFFVLGAASLATFSSAGLLASLGWQAINGLSLFILLVVFGLVMKNKAVLKPATPQ